jgi:hypothetical protein
MELDKDAEWSALVLALAVAVIKPLLFLNNLEAVDVAAALSLLLSRIL